MDIQLSKLKNNFANIMSIRNNTKNIFDILELRIKKLKSTHSELIKKNKTQLFVFGLDSFHFQSKLIDIEYDDMKRIFLAINNRMYCEYYKLYKLIVEYVFETINDKKITEIIKLNKFPIYKDLEPFKEYKIETIMEVHENIIILIASIISTINNKENELEIYKNKKDLGLSLDNFVNSFNFDIIIMREKVKLFLMYIDFFHKLHTKYLKRFSNKLQLMYTHITNEIKFDDFVNLDNNKKKEIIDDFDTTKMDKELLDDLKTSIHIQETIETKTSDILDSNNQNLDEPFIIDNNVIPQTPLTNNNDLNMGIINKNIFQNTVGKIIHINNTIKKFKNIEKSISDEEMNMVFKNIDETCDEMINENVLQNVVLHSESSENVKEKILVIEEKNENITSTDETTTKSIIQENIEFINVTSSGESQLESESGTENKYEIQPQNEVKEIPKKKRGRKKKTQ